jgi:8-oxo-dGTP diphosphatase
MASHPSTPQHWPKAAASAAVLRGNEVLIVERGKGARAGSWSFPGGHIEPGETAAEAARREVREETGLEVEIIELLGVRDVVIRDRDGQLRAHYLLAVYLARWLGGEPAAASDTRDARFVAVDNLHGYDLTEGLREFIDRARMLLDRAP